jgi:pimeloyl-ACP methyl ester carboxylesterase
LRLTRAAAGRQAAVLTLLATLAAVLVAGCGGDSDETGPSGSRLYDPARDGDFYRPPPELVPEEPGRLIWVERIDTRIPMDAWRILYTSEDAGGATIPVSGLLASPEGPGRDLPLVSFAYPTLGVGDECAPSAPQNNPYGLFFLAFLVAEGWTTVASDYQGLGPPGPHQFLVGESEGRAVLDAARAAQRLRPAGAGGAAAVVGSSQGGHAALFAGELAPRYAPGLDLVGVAALAAPSHLGRYLDDGGVLPFAPFAAIGIGDAYGRDPGAGLDEHDRALLERAARECSDTLGQVTPQFHDRRFVDRGPFDEESWCSLLERQDPGRAPIEAPVLLLQGEEDPIVPAASARRLFRRMCAQGDRVEFHVFPGVEHTGGEAGLLQASAGSTLFPWLQARFEGLAARSNCP